MTIRVGGLVRFSTCDYPGHLAAVVFCQGCVWRCHYCHNPHLWPLVAPQALKWRDVGTFLEARRGLLDAVVFSGGEPLLQRGLLDAIREVRALGFKVGLHTAGIYPRRLARLLPWLDWVGLDVKTAFAEYPRVTGLAGSEARAQASVQLLLASGIAYELRTTVHPALISPETLRELAFDLAAMGARNYAIQAFRAMGVRDPVLARSSLDGPPWGQVLDEVSRCFAQFTFRAG